MMLGFADEPVLMRDVNYQGLSSPSFLEQMLSSAVDVQGEYNPGSAFISLRKLATMRW